MTVIVQPDTTFKNYQATSVKIPDFRQGPHKNDPGRLALPIPFRAGASSPLLSSFQGQKIQDIGFRVLGSSVYG